MPFTLPLPLPSVEETQGDEKRLWIGNLDPRVTEYHLLKILQKFGSIEKFDLLYHKTGPQTGQPRGYAFVTYATKSMAEKFLADLNGKKLGSKTLVIKWAHTMDRNEINKPKVELKIPALGVIEPKKPNNRLSQIQAIELKLKMMEQLPKNDFQITNAPSSSSAPPPQPRRQKQEQKSDHTSRVRYRDYKNRKKPYYRK